LEDGGPEIIITQLWQENTLYPLVQVTVERDELLRDEMLRLSAECVIIAQTTEVCFLVYF